ncbi:hypothetical protein M011DRAFT_475753 [Sporormia fimetaria CBS 119925]|uniref:Rhodopsin domain-containing protein n=1 Tax=Sporormia fimetaria CBS 119925 TaxID=1340428 RepID=A0A6A6VIG4_9PLEO|nr:hypothetical protein M011DRAFT_475753 [Sporormia fimetaria CBS 119925]
MHMAVQSQSEPLKPASNFVLINTLAISFASFSSAAVLLRLYTRTRILRIFGPDDVTIGIAQVLSIAVSITTVLEVVWGLGQHTQFVSREDAIRQAKCLYANTYIYNAAQIMTKISFLIQYRRLFPSDRILTLCCWLLVLITAWGVAQEFLVGFACTPLTIFKPHMKGKCIYSLPIWYLTSGMNIVTDFLIFGIPIHPVLQLRISKRKKLLLLGLFCLGFFTCFISLIRLTTLHKSIHTTDPFWDNAPTAYWSVVELNCGILCACLPTLRPLVQRILPRLVGTDRKGRSVRDEEVRIVRRRVSSALGEKEGGIERDMESEKGESTRQASEDMGETVGIGVARGSGGSI